MAISKIGYNRYVTSSGLEFSIGEELQVIGTDWRGVVVRYLDELTVPLGSYGRKANHVEALVLVPPDSSSEFVRSGLMSAVLVQPSMLEPVEYRAGGRSLLDMILGLEGTDYEVPASGE
jgi:hypothetical protein